MIEPCFTYFSIDIGDIWSFESGLFLDNGDNLKLLESSIERIRNKTIERGRPSVTYDHSQYSDDMIRYYSGKVERFLNAKDLKALVSLGYFVSRDDLYQYGQNIIITKEDPDFDYWFVLKLRQYDLGLKHLNDFLNYHLENSFENNKFKFKEFLELILLQYENLPISQRVNQLAQKFMNSVLHLDPKKEESKIPPKTNKRPRSIGNFHSFKLTALQSNPSYFITRKHEIKEIFQDLIDYGFIKEKSSFATFENIFSNQKIPKDKRITWVGGYIYLKLFIRFLLDNQKIELMGNDHWVIMTQCFLNHDGKELDIVKVSKANGGKPKRKKLLDSILEKL
ncbi:hypothetical protein ACSTS3_18640 [Aquimarina muelleri]|uniref:hypothetical protein n=1 Tax=Aquimarina muelleri TaxID=279356 RepID=UPI003F684FF9